MSATVSNLQLDTYYLKEISYSIKNELEKIPENLDREIEPIGLEIEDLTTPIDQNNYKWRCQLTVKSTEDADENPYYNFQIVMVGFFRVNENFAEEHAQILAQSNCPAVLYSTSREIVATVTRRSPYPAVLLPLVTFVKPQEDKEKPKPKRKRKAATKKEKLDE